MNTLQNRRRRISKPCLESLDDRIVPSAAGSAILAQALEARAIHLAEVRAARAEHRAEIQAERAQRMEMRAEHRAEIQAERAQRRELQAEQRAQIMSARQAHFATLRAARFGPNAVAFRGALSQGRAVTAANTAATTPTQHPSVAIARAFSSSPAAVADTSATTANSASSDTARPIVLGTSMTTVGSLATTGGGGSSDVKNGPLAKAGQDLIEVYNQYENSNGSGDFSLDGALANRIRIQGDSVGVDVGTNPSNMAAVSSTLTGLGMQITATDATTGTIEGFLPIVALPTVAQNSDVLTLGPNYLPVMPPPVVPGGGIQAL